MPGSAIGSYSNIGELPAEVQDIFYDEKGKDTETPKLVKAVGFTNEQKVIFFDAVKQVFLRQISPRDIFGNLKDKVPGIPAEKFKKFVCDYIGYLFLQLDDFFEGDASVAIKDLGGAPDDYQVVRVTLRSLTPEEVVSEVLHENTLPLPARLEGRLREILESFVRGVRSKDDTVHRLTRAEKIGGVAFMDDEAEKIVTTLAEKTASVKIDFSAPAVAEVAEARPQLSEVSPQSSEVSPQASPQTPPVVLMSSMTVKPPEVKREISLSDANVEYERQLSSAAVRVAGASGVAVPMDLNDRFMAIVVAMLKEARKPADTLETLKKPVVAGGMGFTAEAAQKIVDLLQVELGKIQLATAEIMKKEKEDFAKRQSRETIERENARESAEAAARDKLYGKLSGQNPATQLSAPQAPQPVVPASALTELSPEAPRPVAPVPPIATEVQPQREPSPVPQKIAVPLPPVPMPPPVAPLPKMQDIRKVAVRLTGPAEELRNMNVQDFRRLSSDPQEACRKLNDKVLLLDEQSYAERAEGVKAWQESPLYKLYLSILNESFGGGGGVSAVIRARETSNKETLTEAEVRGIMELNRKLKS